MRNTNTFHFFKKYTSIDPKQHRAGHKPWPQTTEPGHRVHRRDHEKDKRRTRGGQEDKMRTQGPDKLDKKRRTRPATKPRVGQRDQKTRDGYNAARGQQQDRATKPSPEFRGAASECGQPFF